MTTKTICLNLITVKELKEFLTDISDNIEICVDDDGGSGYVEGCFLEHIKFDDTLEDELYLTIEARSCYY